MTVNRSDFIGKPQRASVDDDALILAWDPTDAQGEPYVAPLSTLAELPAVSSRSAPLAGALTLFDYFGTVGTLTGQTTPWGRTYAVVNAFNTTETGLVVEAVGKLSMATAGAAYFNFVGSVAPEMISMEVSFDAGSTVVASAVMGTSPLTGPNSVGASGYATNSIHCTFAPTAWTVGYYDGTTLTVVGSGNYSTTAGVRYRVAVQRISETYLLVYLPGGGTPTVVTIPDMPLYWGRTSWFELYQPDATFATDQRPHIHAIAVEGVSPENRDQVRVNCEALAAVTGSPSRSYVGNTPAWGFPDAATSGVAAVIDVPNHWNTFDIKAVFSPQGTAANAVQAVVAYKWVDHSNTNLTSTTLTAQTVTISGTASTSTTQTMGSGISVDKTGKRLWIRLLRLGTDAADTHTDTVFVPEIRIERAS